MERHTQSITDHYRRDGLAEIIREALAKDGKDLDNLTIDDLAPVDEFHTRGREATVELAEFAGIEPGMRVVDVGSGLGGPARYLAQTYGCTVAGVDLSEEFCRTATMLAEMTGLADKVSFQHASALDMPFEDASFDLAWTVQIQMNIADKARFYGEIFRVLEPGGRFVFQDILQGPGGPIRVPTPWASEPGMNFLYSPAKLSDLLTDVGFEQIEWRDRTDAHREWYDHQPEATGKPMPKLSIHLVLGPEAGEKRRNTRQNLLEDRIAYVQAILCKPD